MARRPPQARGSMSASAYPSWRTPNGRPRRPFRRRAIGHRRAAPSAAAAVEGLVPDTAPQPVTSCRSEAAAVVVDEGFFGLGWSATVRWDSRPRRRSISPRAPCGRRCCASTSGPTAPATATAAPRRRRARRAGAAAEHAGAKPRRGGDDRRRGLRYRREASVRLRDRIARRGCVGRVGGGTIWRAFGGAWGSVAPCPGARLGCARIARLPRNRRGTASTTHRMLAVKR